MPNHAQLKLRLTESLRARIEEAAAVNGVSMNAEMIARLENSFAAERSERVEAMLAELLARIPKQTEPDRSSA